MKKVLFLFIFLFSFQISWGQETAFRKDIYHLLDVSGSKNASYQAMEQMITMFKTTMPEVPTEFWDDFLKEIDIDELVNLLIPVYEKHYTHKDVKKLIKFYKSPTGKKMTKVLPDVMNDSMLIGQEWGAQIGEKIMLRILEREAEEKPISN